MSIEITSASAAKAIEVGKIEATELGIPFTIVIVDAEWPSWRNRGCGS